MKNIYLVTFIAIFTFISCEDGREIADGNNNPPLSDEELLVIKSTCSRCHDISDNFFGPSISEISGKYSNADIKDLVKIVSKGKKAKDLIWGSAPKNAREYSEEEIRTVVEWMVNFSNRTSGKK